MLRVDLNCDLGEGCGYDAAIMPFITSANIACGYHAGDAATMTETIKLALEHNVNIGAHPGYLDRENFGRTEMSLSAEDVYKIVGDQIDALAEIAHSNGAQLRHVKPHGALYNQAARDPELAIAIAKAVKDHDPSLILFGLSGSPYIDEAEALGLTTAAEVFADRTYQADGSLTSRKLPNALITDVAAASAQALQMVQNSTVTTTDGGSIPVRADTICLHGDGSTAVEMAAAIRDRLWSSGVHIRPL